VVIQLPLSAGPQLTPTESRDPGNGAP
jgi:hypothetical protein